MANRAKRGRLESLFQAMERKQQQQQQPGPRAGCSDAGDAGNRQNRVPAARSDTRQSAQGGGEVPMGRRGGGTKREAGAAGVRGGTKPKKLRLAAPAGEAEEKRRQALKLSLSQADACEAAARPPSSHRAADMAPVREADLVVNKKKVQEVKAWLAYHSARPQRRRGAEGGEEQRAGGCPMVLLLSGPPGCGKSTLLDVLAAGLGFQLCEWVPPVPTLWSEFQAQGPQSQRYTSKLDEFEQFVVHASYPLLPVTAAASTAGQPAWQASQSSQCSSQPSCSITEVGGNAAGQAPRKLMVLEDLPFVGGSSERLQRLTALLQRLAGGAREPVALLLTTGKDRSASSRTEQALVTALTQNAPAAVQHVSLNPLPVTSIAKAVLAAAERIRFALDKSAAQQLALAADGDLAHALQQLLLDARRSALMQVAPAAKAKWPPRRCKRQGSSTLGNGSLSALRDSSLSMFHALGKILYHRRQPPDGLGARGARSKPAPPQTMLAMERGEEHQSQAAAACSQMYQQWMRMRGDSAGADEVAPAREASRGARMEADGARGRNLRPPLECDPEEVVMRAGMSGATVAGHIHENYCSFIAETAVDDAAAAAGYLSDALLMACAGSSGARGGLASMWVDADFGSSSLLDAAAASTAARGFIWSNARPAPTGWTQILPCKASKVAAGAAANAAHAMRQVAIAAATPDDRSQRCLPAGCSGRLYVEEILPSAKALCSKLAAAPANGPPGVILHHQQLRATLQQLLPQQWHYFWQGSVVDGNPSLHLPPDPAPASSTAALAAASCLHSEPDDDDPIEDAG